MILEFTSSEFAKLEIFGVEYEIKDKLDVEVEFNWNDTFMVTLSEVCTKFKPCPLFRFDTFELKMEIKDHFILQIKNLFSTFVVSNLTIFSQVLSLGQFVEIASLTPKEKQRSTYNLSDDVVVKEVSPDESLKYFEKIAYKKYENSYFLVDKQYLKTLLAFGKSFEIKLDPEMTTELKWGLEFDQILDKCVLLLKGNTKIRFEIVSFLPIFKISQSILGSLSESKLFSPKFDYTKVVKQISEEMMIEIYKIHELMFGKADRPVEKQDYQLFKDKLESLGIIEKYQKAFKHILQQNVHQDSFEKSYMMLTSKIKEYALQKKFDTIVALNQQIPYLDAIKNSIFLAKVANDQWALQFYHDQVLIYNDSVDGRLTYSKFLIFSEKYDQAFELLLSLPLNRCQFELAVCEFYLGHLESSLYRCQNMEPSIHLTMFLYFSLKQESYVDNLVKFNGILDPETIGVTVELLDDLGLSQLSDELLRAMVSKHSLISILLRHLTLNRRFDDVLLICNDDYIPYKLLAKLVLRLTSSADEKQKLQMHCQSTKDTFAMQILLWIAVDNEVVFENWSTTLQIANCPFVFELLWQSNKLNPDVRSLVEKVFSFSSSAGVPLVPIEVNLF